MLDRFVCKFKNPPYLPSQRICTNAVKGLVSVVLPVFNGEKYLDEAIVSVINQTYKFWELIIVDDGSVDSSLETAQKYAAADNRIKVVHQENLKLPTALNNGFAEARGEFFTWHSADNRMLPDCLEVMAGELKRHRCTDMVYANEYLIDGNGKIITGHGWFEIPPNSGNVIFPPSARFLNTIPNNTVGAAFMYRSGTDAVLGGYDPRMFLLEDYDYFMRMNSLFRIKHVRHTAPIYAYRFHDGSLTSKDKELGITAARPRLMAFDRKRRKEYKKALHYSAEHAVPIPENVLYKYKLYKSSKNDFCLDDYKIIKNNGYFEFCIGNRFVCRLTSETDAAKFLRLRAVCDIMRRQSL